MSNLFKVKLKFPKWTLNSNAIIYQSDVNVYGEPIKTEIYKGKVNHENKTKQVLNANRELILLSGSVIIPGDIHLPNYSVDKPLYVLVNGLEKRVFSVNKPHNPDGSIFSTELMLE